MAALAQNHPLAGRNAASLLFSHHIPLEPCICNARLDEDNPQMYRRQTGLKSLSVLETEGIPVRKKVGQGVLQELSNAPILRPVTPLPTHTNILLLLQLTTQSLEDLTYLHCQERILYLTCRFVDQAMLVEIVGRALLLAVPSARLEKGNGKGGLKIRSSTLEPSLNPSSVCQN